MYNEGLDPNVTAGLGLMFWAFILGVYLFFGYTQYKIAQKCNCRDEAWWSFIPVLNVILQLKMAEKPNWWFFLYLIPIVNLFVIFSVWIEIAKNAGHSTMWGVFAVLPFLNIIALIVMAFTGDAPQRHRPMPPTQREEHRTPTHVG